MGLKLRLDTESPGAGVTCNRQRKHHPVKSNPGFFFSPGKAAAEAHARTSKDLLGLWLAALAPAGLKLAIAVGGWGGVRRIWERRGETGRGGRGDFGGFGGGFLVFKQRPAAESREIDVPRGCVSPRVKMIHGGTSRGMDALCVKRGWASAGLYL